jgi:hypothetical protein
MLSIHFPIGMSSPVWQINLVLSTTTPLPINTMDCHGTATQWKEEAIKSDLGFSVLGGPQSFGDVADHDPSPVGGFPLFWYVVLASSSEWWGVNTKYWSQIKILSHHMLAMVVQLALAKSTWSCVPGGSARIWSIFMFVGGGTGPTLLIRGFESLLLSGALVLWGLNATTFHLFTTSSTNMTRDAEDNSAPSVWCS